MSIWWSENAAKHLEDTKTSNNTKMENQESKKYKLLRTGGDCEGVFTVFLFLHGKKEKKIISKNTLHNHVCVLHHANPEEHKRRILIPINDFSIY